MMPLNQSVIQPSLNPVSKFLKLAQEPVKLTAKLTRAWCKVTALEYDPELIPALTVVVLRYGEINYNS